MSDGIGHSGGGSPAKAFEGAHLRCGQLCEKDLCRARAMRHAQAQAAPAEKSGSQNMMKIKGLHEDVSSMTALCLLSALQGATVEFRVGVLRPMRSA